MEIAKSLSDLKASFVSEIKILGPYVNFFVKNKQPKNSKKLFFSKYKYVDAQNMQTSQLN